MDLVVPSPCETEPYNKTHYLLIAFNNLVCKTSAHANREIVTINGNKRWQGKKALAGQYMRFCEIEKIATKCFQVFFTLVYMVYIENPKISKLTLDFSVKPLEFYIITY